MTCSSLQPSLRHLLLQVLVAAVCVPPLLRPPLAFTGDPFVRPFRCCHNLFHHIHPSILTCISSDIFCLALCLLCARAHIHMHTHTHSHSMSSQARSAALDPRGSLLTSDLGLENAPFRDHPNTWKRSQAVWVVCVCVSSSVCLCFHVHVSRLPACLECRLLVMHVLVCGFMSASIKIHALWLCAALRRGAYMDILARHPPTHLAPTPASFSRRILHLPPTPALSSLSHRSGSSYR